jgi:hypothetical protein
VGDTFFREKRSVTDVERSGWSATGITEENFAKVRRLTVRSIAEQANINTETVSKILTEDLDMR